MMDGSIVVGNRVITRHWCTGMARRVTIHNPNGSGARLYWNEWVLRFNVYPRDQESPPETFFLDGGGTYEDARERAQEIATKMRLGVVHTNRDVPDMWEIAEGWMTPFEWGFEASLFITRASSTDVANHHLFVYNSFMNMLRALTQADTNIP